MSSPQNRFDNYYNHESQRENQSDTQTTRKVEENEKNVIIEKLLLTETNRGKPFFPF